MTSDRHPSGRFGTELGLQQSICVPSLACLRTRHDVCVTIVWAGAFAWMGTGCVLNALRYARLHCYISGPVLWLGALAASLVGIGIVSAPHALEDVVNATVILVVVSWLPEWLPC